MPGTIARADYGELVFQAERKELTFDPKSIKKCTFYAEPDLDNANVGNSIFAEQKNYTSLTLVKLEIGCFT